MLGSLLSKSVFLLSEVDVIIPDQEGVSVSTMGMSSWPSPLVIILCVALACVGLGLVVIVLLQKKRASGIGAAIAGSGETYWSKNKGKSPEGALEKYTKWGGAAFIIIALLINILM